MTDDALNDLRESKRMKISSDLSESFRLDASEGVSGTSSVSTSLAKGSPSVAHTHDAEKKLARSVKRSTSVGYAKAGKTRRTSERRNRRGTRNEPTVGEDAGASVPKAPRLPKRQCALLIGFCGSGYSGMQMYACCDPSQSFLCS
jgi:tRNA pseudouridine38-40 synthase